MAAEEAWACPICRDTRRDVAYAMPCRHKFCLGCIQRWARLKASCPLCRTAMGTIRVSVWGDDHYVECVVSPPNVPVPADLFQDTASRPDGTVPRAPSPRPLPPQQRDAQLHARGGVGGLLPEEWAAVFREHRHILAPVLPSLHQELSAIQGMQWWEVLAVESLILNCLCHLGLDRDAVARCIELSVGPIAAPLINWLVNSIVSQCSQEARRLLGLNNEGAAQRQEDSPAAASPQDTLTPSATPSGSSADSDVEELPSTSSGVLQGGAGELPAAPSLREQEQPHEESRQEAAGPSAQGCSPSCSAPEQGRKDSSGRPRRRRHPKKRRAGSTQDAPQPCKRPPPRHR